MPVDTKQLRKMAQESESIDLFEDAETLTAAADEIDALRKQVAEIPSWQDKPTCAGKWIGEWTVKGSSQKGIEWFEIVMVEGVSHFVCEFTGDFRPVPSETLASKWKFFGPIPLPTEGVK